MESMLSNNAAVGASIFDRMVRPEVGHLPNYNAGLSIDHVRNKYHVERVAKLGSNENPLGASLAVDAAIRHASGAIALYPDSACSALRSVLAAQLDVAPENFVFGNGSEDLIAIVTRTLLSAGDEVVTMIPSFGLHITYPESMGALVHAVPLTPEYAMDVDALIAALNDKTKMLIISNPSNPVGVTMPLADMRRLFGAVSPDTLIVWDEAYYEYAAADPDYPDSLAELNASQRPYLLLRTFSKAYSLAGLRIGYGVSSDPALVDYMGRIRTPFNVNHLAQHAAIAALSDPAHLQAGVQHVVAERARMRAALKAMGYQPALSAANFLFFDTRRDASKVAEHLLARGVIVKPWREKSYTGCIRVSIGSKDDNDLFLEVLTQLGNVA